MCRSLSGVWICWLCLGVVVWAEDSQAPSEKVPPWQRVLEGEDAKRAEELATNVAELSEADDYAEAIAAAEELLALRKRVQGADHWQTATAKWDLDALGRVQALPADQRVAWRAAAGDAEAGQLEGRARYADALPLRQTLADLRRTVLGEDHPHTATSYNNVARNLNAQGKYGEAVPLFEMALDIRRRLLGEDHPNTAESYNNAAVNLNAQGKHAEAAPFYRKALDIRRRLLGEDHADTAASYNNVAYNLESQGKYAEAAPLYRKALDIRRRLLGEDHPHTAQSYNNVASNLNAQGKYAEAAPLFQKALDIRRRLLGEDHPVTATSYNNLAFNLDDQGNYAEAAPLYQKALDICRRLLGEDHPDTTMSYNNLASNLHAQGKYAEAGPHFLKALDIWRRVLGEDHPLTATSYNNLAGNLDAQGKHAEAAPLYQQALDICRRVLGDEHPDTATSYNNVAGNLEAQNKHAEAAPFHRKALDICRRVLGQEHPLTARSYNNVAGNLNAQGKHAEAAPLYRRALHINRGILGEDHSDTARSYNNVAANLDAQGKYADAGPLFLKALDIWRRVLGEDHALTAMSYASVALNLHAQGKYAEALATLDNGAAAYEAARLRVASRGLERAAFGAGQSPYSFLAAAEARADRPADAWRALEASLARGLLDESGQRAGVVLTLEEEQSRQELVAELARIEPLLLELVTSRDRTEAQQSELHDLLAKRNQADGGLADLAAALSGRQVATLADVQATLPAGTAFIAWVDVSDRSGGINEHWGCVVRRRGLPRWERLPGSGPEERWTEDETALPLRLREALAQGASKEEVEVLSQRLAAQRIEPLLPHMEGVQRLFVAGVNEMAGVPVDLLTDRFTISYTPSGTQLVRLKEQERAPGDATLLALGDAVFNQPRDDEGEAPAPTALPSGGLLITQVVPEGNAFHARLQMGDVLLAYAGTDLTSVEQLGELIEEHASDESVTISVWRETEDQPDERQIGPGKLGVALAREPAPEAIARRREGDLLLASATRGKRWDDLPGTRIEIAGLAELFEARQATLLADSDASEQRLTALLESGELGTFRYLHLATHGEANQAKAFDSALILSQDGLPTMDEVAAGAEFYDGRLTANEVLEHWNLNADMVTLSSCESGLGLAGGGEGFLGFSQALLLAGSRSVCLSLWDVDDTATALLMDRFYKNLLGKRDGQEKPLPKAEALAEAKHWLRNLDLEEATQLTADLSQGVARGAGRKTLPLLLEVPQDTEAEAKPYAHPRYWAAFILIGDPE